jgi:DNA adenine methylase
MIRYQGGKNHTGRPIAEAMLAHCRRQLDKGGGGAGAGNQSLRDKSYFEPFVGAGGVLKHMVPYFSGGNQQRVMANDINPDMMELWTAVVNRDWTPPTRPISRAEWEQLRDSPTKSPLKTFAGLALGWGGAYFQGYVKNAAGRDWVGEAARSVERYKRLLRENGCVPKLYCQSYDTFDVRNCVVYCDPPYASTRSYNGVQQFDSAHFWGVMREWSRPERGNIVFVSEETAPEDFVCIWESDAKRSFGLMRKQEHSDGKDYKKSVERLFVIRSGAASGPHLPPPKSASIPIPASATAVASVASAKRRRNPSRQAKKEMTPASVADSTSFSTSGEDDDNDAASLSSWEPSSSLTSSSGASSSF